MAKTLGAATALIGVVESGCRTDAPTVRSSAARGRSAAVRLLAGAFLASLLSGCSVSPAQQEATRQAWAQRDAERAQECAQKNGRWVAGGCVFGGGM